MGLGRPTERWIGLAKRQEGTNRGCLSQSGEELQNSGSGWRSATFKAVNRELGKAVRKCLLVFMVGQRCRQPWLGCHRELQDVRDLPTKLPEPNKLPKRLSTSRALQLSKPS